MPWMRHGTLNTLEHAITRILDALSTLVLIWALSPELFSKLALAQAVAAPCLLFFIAPEAVFYRDFGRWKAEGSTAFQSRLRAFQNFALGKVFAVIPLSFALAWVIPGESQGWPRFFTLIWAFFLVLTPQFVGPDREFLRIQLRLKELNYLSLIQKSSLLGATALSAFLFPNRLEVLAFSVMAVSLGVIGIARWMSAQALLDDTSSDAQNKGRPIPYRETLWHSIKSFSLSRHLCGIAQDWVLTLDIFFLGYFQLPARQVGLFATVIKLAKLSQALPTALSNLFAIWLGQRTTVSEGQEKSQVFRYSLMLFGVCLVQAAVFYALGPWLIDLFSKGRWSAAEQSMMFEWLGWLLIGNCIFGSLHMLSSWLVVRVQVFPLFLSVYLPWLIFSAGLYAAVAQTQNLLWVAQANAGMSLIYVVLMTIHYFRGKRLDSA